MSISLLSFLLLFDLVAELPLRSPNPTAHPSNLTVSSSRLDSFTSFTVPMSVAYPLFTPSQTSHKRSQIGNQLCVVAEPRFVYSGPYADFQTDEVVRGTVNREATTDSCARIVAVDSMNALSCAHTMFASDDMVRGTVNREATMDSSDRFHVVVHMRAHHAHTRCPEFGGTVNREAISGSTVRSHTSLMHASTRMMHVCRDVSCGTVNREAGTFAPMVSCSSRFASSWLLDILTCIRRYLRDLHKHHVNFQDLSNSSITPRRLEGSAVSLDWLQTSPKDVIVLIIAALNVAAVLVALCCMIPNNSYSGPPSQDARYPDVEVGASDPWPDAASYYQHRRPRAHAASRYSASSSGGKFDKQTPPYWAPNRGVSIRSWVAELSRWVTLTDLTIPQQAVVIRNNLGGSAQAWVDSLSSVEMHKGALLDGVHLDPVSLIVEGLTRRYGEFDEEIANQAKKMLRNFKAHPGETLMDVLTRYDCCLQKVAMEAGYVPDVEDCANQLLSLLQPTREILREILRHTDNKVPKTEADLNQMLVVWRKESRLTEKHPGNWLSAIQGNWSNHPRHAHRGMFLNHEALQEDRLDGGRPSASGSSAFMVQYPTEEAPPQSWTGWASPPPQEYEYEGSTSAYPVQHHASYQQAYPVHQPHAQQQESYDHPDFYVYSDESSTDTSSDDYTEDLSVPLPQPGTIDEGVRLYLAYKRGKKAFRRHVGRPTRRVRRVWKRFSRRRLGSKGKGKNRHGKGSFFGSPYVEFSQFEAFMSHNGRGRASSGKGMGNRIGKNPRDGKGKVMKCFECGSEDHLKANCPHATKAHWAQTQQTASSSSSGGAAISTIGGRVSFSPYVSTVATYGALEVEGSSRPPPQHTPTIPEGATSAGTATFVVLNFSTAAMKETDQPRPPEPMRGRLVERATELEQKLPVAAPPVQSVDTTNPNWQMQQAAAEAQQQVLVVTQAQQGLLAPTGPFGQLQLHDSRSMVDPAGIQAAVRQHENSGRVSHPPPRIGGLELTSSPPRITSADTAIPPPKWPAPPTLPPDLKQPGPARSSSRTPSPASASAVKSWVASGLTNVVKSAFGWHKDQSSPTDMADGQKPPCRYISMSRERDPWLQDATPRVSELQAAPPASKEDLLDCWKGVQPTVTPQQGRMTPTALSMFPPMAPNNIGRIDFTPHNDRQARPPSMLPSVAPEELHRLSPPLGAPPAPQGGLPNYTSGVEPMTQVQGAPDAFCQHYLKQIDPGSSMENITEARSYNRQELIPDTRKTGTTEQQAETFSRFLVHQAAGRRNREERRKNRTQGPDDSNVPIIFRSHNPVHSIMQSQSLVTNSKFKESPPLAVTALTPLQTIQQAQNAAAASRLQKKVEEKALDQLLKPASPQETTTTADCYAECPALHPNEFLVTGLMAMTQAINSACNPFVDKTTKENMLGKMCLLFLERRGAMYCTDFVPSAGLPPSANVPGWSYTADGQTAPYSARGPTTGPEPMPAVPPTRPEIPTGHSVNQMDICFGECQICHEAFVVDDSVALFSCGHTAHYGCFQKFNPNPGSAIKCNACQAYLEGDQFRLVKWHAPSDYPKDGAAQHMHLSSLLTDLTHTEPKSAVPAIENMMSAVQAIQDGSAGDEVHEEQPSSSAGPVSSRWRQTGAIWRPSVAAHAATPSGSTEQSWAMPDSQESHVAFESSTCNFHVNTTLADGRKCIIIDPGSVGNLCGDEWAKSIALESISANRTPSRHRRESPLIVSGVGTGSQQCTHNYILPLAIRKSEMAPGSTPTVAAKLDIPTINNSNLPGLLGLDSTIANRGILDLVNGKMYFCGQGRFNLFDHLPPGTNSFKLERSASGHIVLPICEFVHPDSSDPALSLMSTHTPDGIRRPEQIPAPPWGAPQFPPGFYDPVNVPLGAAPRTPSTPSFMRSREPSWGGCSESSHNPHYSSGGCDSEGINRWPSVRDEWEPSHASMYSRHGRTWVRTHYQRRKQLFVPQMSTGEPGVPNPLEIGPFRRTIMNFADGTTETYVDDYRNGPPKEINEYWDGYTIFFDTFERDLAGLNVRRCQGRASLKSSYNNDWMPEQVAATADDKISTVLFGFKGPPEERDESFVVNGDFWSTPPGPAGSHGGYGRFWVRHHTSERSCLFTPVGTDNVDPKAPYVTSLGPWRRTIINYTNGMTCTLVDNWRNNDRPHARMPDLWTGYTIFYESQSRSVAGNSVEMREGRQQPPAIPPLHVVTSRGASSSSGLGGSKGSRGPY